MCELTGFALVTGAASGIGLEIAKAFCKAGVSGISLVDLNEDGLKNAEKECRGISTQRDGVRILLQAVDCTSEEAVEAAVWRSHAAFQRLDYAVNCAGLVQAAPKTFGTTSTDIYDNTFNINSRGLFFCMRAEIQVMKEQAAVSSIIRPYGSWRGSIVNVSSAASVVAIPGLSSYVGSKHAVTGLTKSAATDHTSDLIRINAVSPGYVETRLTTELTKDLPEMKEQMSAASLLRRMGKPEEIADVVVFLASPKASFIVGQNIIIDGGVTVV